MEILRTPDERFADLPGYNFTPHYVEINGLRIHYIDEGPEDADPVLLLHGEPSWSYLYRKMIPILTAAGYRAVAPDLVGFGRVPCEIEPHRPVFLRADAVFPIIGRYEIAAGIAADRRVQFADEINDIAAHAVVVRRRVTGFVYTRVNGTAEMLQKGAVKTLVDFGDRVARMRRDASLHLVSSRIYNIISGLYRNCRYCKRQDRN